MIPELTQLGFTRNEANVYFAALRMGKTTVQKLANATGLNRITVHSIVERFESMHIFTHIYESRHRRISAVDPARLEHLLIKEKQELQHKQNVLNQIMPGLKDLHRRGRRGMNISVFYGEEGYEEMCEDVLRSNSPMLEYANIDALNAVIGPYIAQDYLPRKHKLQISTKFLYIDTPSARSYIQKSYMKKGAAPMEAKFINPKMFPMDSFYVIYANKLMIFTPSTMDGVIIEDKAVADSFRPFFRFVWERAGEMTTNK